jgi:hypothetical protein
MGIECRSSHELVKKKPWQHTEKIKVATELYVAAGCADFISELSAGIAAEVRRSYS